MPSSTALRKGKDPASNSVAPGANGATSEQSATPQLHPKLISLGRVITANKAFRSLIDNFDAFAIDDYMNCELVTSIIAPEFHGMVELLQSRERGEHYFLDKLLETAGDTLAAAMETGLPTPRKGGVLLEAFRPYLLLDKWITAFRTNPCTMSMRPVIPLEALVIKENNAKIRKAMHKSYFTTMRKIAPAKAKATTTDAPGQSLPEVPHPQHVWSYLIQKGIGAKKRSKISIAEYRFAAMAIVITFFTKKHFSFDEIQDKAAEVFAHVPEAEWREVVKDGISWLGMALLTTLKDSLVYAPHEPPSVRFLFFVGNRYRQQIPTQGFIELEAILWRHLFNTALMNTTESLEVHLGNLGTVAEAERPDTVNLLVVPLVDDIPSKASRKRKQAPLSPEEELRMHKRLRDGSEYLDVMEDDDDDDNKAIQPEGEQANFVHDGSKTSGPLFEDNYHSTEDQTPPSEPIIRRPSPSSLLPTQLDSPKDDANPSPIEAGVRALTLDQRHPSEQDRIQADSLSSLHSQSPCLREKSVGPSGAAGGGISSGDVPSMKMIVEELGGAGSGGNADIAGGNASHGEPPLGEKSLGSAGVVEGDVSLGDDTSMQMTVDEVGGAGADTGGGGNASRRGTPLGEKSVGSGGVVEGGVSLGDDTSMRMTVDEIEGAGAITGGRGNASRGGTPLGEKSVGSAGVVEGGVSLGDDTSMEMTFKELGEAGADTGGEGNAPRGGTPLGNKSVGSAGVVEGVSLGDDNSMEMTVEELEGAGGGNTDTADGGTASPGGTASRAKSVGSLGGDGGGASALGGDTSRAKSVGALGGTGGGGGGRGGGTLNAKNVGRPGRDAPGRKLRSDTRSDATPDTADEVVGKNVGGHNLRNKPPTNLTVDQTYPKVSSATTSRRGKGPSQRIKREFPGITEVLRLMMYGELNADELVDKIKSENLEDDYYPVEVNQSSIVSNLDEQDVSMDTSVSGENKGEDKEGGDNESEEEEGGEKEGREKGVVEKEGGNKAGGDKTRGDKAAPVIVIDDDELEDEVPKKWRLREDASAPSPAKTVKMNVDGANLTMHTWYDGDFAQLTKFKGIFEARKVKTDMVHAFTYDDFTQESDDPTKRLEKILSLKKIFNKHHVLVTGCPPLISAQDLERRLGMKRKVEIQDLWYRRKNQIPCHSMGTLERMQRIMKKDGTRPMNALDLPCGHIKIETPRLLDISFRDTVWSSLRFIERPTFEETMPMDDFRWALHSSRNAYSTPHIDSNGLWTVIAPVDCQKLWILGRPKKESVMDTRAFSTFEMYDLKIEDYDWEPILLKPGDLLYMKPGTVHAVVTIQPGFTIGEHFLTMDNLHESLASTLHLSTKHEFLTNASHNLAVSKTLCRLIHCWRMRLDDDVEDDDLPKIDFLNRANLKSLVMLGAYIHMVVYIEEQIRGLTLADTKQLAVATEDYQILYSYFNQYYKVDGLRYKKYLFPEDDSSPQELKKGEKGKDQDRDCALDMIFRNGGLWVIANICVFWKRDKGTSKEVLASKKRLESIVGQVIVRYKVRRQFFDRMVAWIDKNFLTARIDDWIDWDVLSITELLPSHPPPNPAASSTYSSPLSSPCPSPRLELTTLPS